MHNLRNKLMHYTNDLSDGVDLKAEAIAAIEHIVQYMNEDELLHHSRPLALAYLALTEEVASVPVVHGRWIEKSAPARKIYFECSQCGAHENKHTAIKGYYCWRCGAKMDGGDSDAAD